MCRFIQEYVLPSPILVPKAPYRWNTIDLCILAFPTKDYGRGTIRANGDYSPVGNVHLFQLNLLGWIQRDAYGIGVR